MIVDINGSVIFALLPLNILGLGLTMYIMEHVSFFNIFQHKYYMCIKEC